MLFNSFEFLVFLIVCFTVYWTVLKGRTKLQNAFLLIISYVFYGWWDWRFLSLIAFSSLVDYGVGRALQNEERPKQRKLFLAISLLTNFGLLGVFKYFNFFADNFALLLNQIGMHADMVTLQIVLPVGISFYTFQTVGYSIDIYRKDIQPERNLIQFMAYVSFFPQLVAGPIERASNLLPQFKVARYFDPISARNGMRLILWGFFKKVVIADNCAPLVDQIFAEPAAASGIELIWGAVLFAFQIYGDFSGYSDIAIGVASLFGFQLMTNFRTPYFSRDVAEFWRRWHISLSTWFRDYLYIPLGGSRGPRHIVLRNVFVIFLVSGFWHGANWTFIVWGGLHALLFLPLIYFDRNRKNLNEAAEERWLPSGREFLQMLLTFTLVCIAWVFFRAENVSEAGLYLWRIVKQPFLPEESELFPIYLFVMIFFLLLVDWNGRKYGVDLMLENINARWKRWTVYYLILMCIIFYGAFEHTAFIYFQF